MKRFLKLFMSTSLMFCLILLSQVNESYANESKENLINYQAKVTITNNETGEATVLNMKSSDLKSNMRVNSVESKGESTTVGYDIFVPIPIEDSNSSDITPFTSEGKEKTDGGITAKLYVDYDISSNNEEVRVNKVWGSWTPNSYLYNLTDREVGAHSGVSFYGKKLSKTPTSNTFSYTTGWGYNPRIWGDASPRAWSSAISRISGMTATYTIKVEFSFS